MRFGQVGCRPGSGRSVLAIRNYCGLSRAHVRRRDDRLRRPSQPDDDCVVRSRFDIDPATRVRTGSGIGTEVAPDWSGCGRGAGSLNARRRRRAAEAVCAGCAAVATGRPPPATTHVVVTLLDAYRAARRRWVVLRVSLRMSSNPTRLDARRMRRLRSGAAGPLALVKAFQKPFFTASGGPLEWDGSGEKPAKELKMNDR